MELWNDYEGKTVAGVYPLERLLSPEGRSAFFATKDGSGGPAVMRLIESHFDEQEILSRWATVAGLRQENLVEIERSGEAEIGGTKLVYAVLEQTDAALAEILRERPLTAEETKQVGASVAAALGALHGAGLVHEHVEPANVLAKGEVVKLRSDCVREAPEGAEGEQARARDVEALAVLLHQSLTQRRELGVGGPLPYPYEEMVRKGVSGAWGLAEMAQGLGQPTPLVPGGRGPSGGRGAISSETEKVVARGPAGVAVRPGMAPAASAAAVPGVVAAQAVRVAPGGRPGVGARPATAANGGSAGRSGAAVAEALERPRTAVAEAPGAAGAGAAGSGTAGAGPVSSMAAYARVERGTMPVAPDRIVMEPRESSGRTPKIVGGALAAVLLALLGWRMVHKPAAPVAAPVVQGPGPSAAPAAVPGVAAQKPSAIAARRAGSNTGSRQEAVIGAAAGARTAGHAGGRTNWRVVAYTYNREDQAQHKVGEIAARHAGLKPAVFTPTGRAPYLVTLGGEMTSEQAVALRNKAWSEGMPRDTFARNYGGR